MCYKVKIALSGNFILIVVFMIKYCCCRNWRTLVSSRTKGGHFATTATPRYFCSHWHQMGVPSLGEENIISCSLVPHVDF